VLVCLNGWIDGGAIHFILLSLATLLWSSCVFGWCWCIFKTQFFKLLSSGLSLSPHWFWSPSLVTLFFTCMWYLKMASTKVDWLIDWFVAQPVHVVDQNFILNQNVNAFQFCDVVCLFFSIPMILLLMLTMHTSGSWPLLFGMSCFWSFTSTNEITLD
jgi:hypothetical protein